MLKDVVAVAVGAVAMGIFLAAGDAEVIVEVVEVAVVVIVSIM